MTFKFVEEDTTDLTAADATEEDQLQISGIFIGQTKKVSFMIGNTGSDWAYYEISTSGLNTSVHDDVEYSTDRGLTWATTANTGYVEPNGLSERIIVRFTPDDEEILGVGTFLVRVDEG